MLDYFSTFTTIFLSIFIEAIPFLLLGILASGLVEVFFRQDEVSRLVPKSPIVAAMVGGLLGLFIPVGKYGVVPLVRRLFRKGSPFSLGVSFLLAAPAINPIAIAGTLGSFGPGIIFWGRLGLTFIVAVATGALFSLQADRQQLLLPDRERHSFRSFLPAVPLEFVDELPLLPVENWRGKAGRALVIAGDEFFEFSRYLVIGSSVAALLQMLVPQPALEESGRGLVLSVGVMILMAVLLSAGSTADAFIALRFIGSYASGSILAFLVYGSMVDIKTVLMFRRVFRGRSVLYLVLLPLMMTVVGALFFNMVAR